jgi:N-acetylmuramoyl-L-alanine amidase
VIQNHRLIGVPFIESPNCGGALSPEVLVLHYTVSWPASAVIAGFRRPASRASAHLVLDLDGQFTQMVPFHRQAWHAGVSEWRGRQKLNHWSLGIEIVNPGPVFPGESVTIDDNKRTWKGGFKPGPTDPALLPKGCPKHWKHWATYDASQIQALESVCRELVVEYGLKEIVGHSDVSPGRKFDPGPIFPMERIRTAAFRRDSIPIAPPIDPKNLPTLRKGPKLASTVPHVSLAQERLNVHGADPKLLVDGDFGGKTQNAVVDFQKRRGIDDDGVIGKQSWPLLLADP